MRGKHAELIHELRFKKALLTHIFLIEYLPTYIKASDKYTRHSIFIRTLALNSYQKMEYWCS